MNMAAPEWAGLGLMCLREFIGRLCVVLHGGVNMWNLQYTGAIGAESEKNQAAIEVYNKYGGALNPETSQWAFCALRRGLDASDTVSWPEDKYGTAYDANGSQLSNNKHPSRHVMKIFWPILINMVPPSKI